MASGMYTAVFTEAFQGNISINNDDTVRCALMDNNHSYDPDDTDWSDVSANELADGNGYNANGEALTSTAVTQDDADNEMVFDAADVQWTSATFTAYHAVLYDDTHASDCLILSVDFGGAQTVAAGTFKIQWATEGIFNVNV